MGQDRKFGEAASRSSNVSRCAMGISGARFLNYRSRIAAFLIDTPAIRNAVKSRQCNAGAHSNRHSSGPSDLNVAPRSSARQVFRGQSRRKILPDQIRRGANSASAHGSGARDSRRMTAKSVRLKTMQRCRAEAAALHRQRQGAHLKGGRYEGQCIRTQRGAR